MWIDSDELIESGFSKYPKKNIFLHFECVNFDKAMTESKMNRLTMRDGKMFILCQLRPCLDIKEAYFFLHSICASVKAVCCDGKIAHRTSCFRVFKQCISDKVSFDKNRF